MRPVVGRLSAKPSRSRGIYAGRGYAVDHSTIERGVIHYAPRIGKAFRKIKNRAGNKWRLNETYIKIKFRDETFFLSIQNFS